MSDVTVVFTTSLLFLLITFVTGNYRGVGSYDVGNCSLTSNVLNCSSRGYFSVPPIEKDKMKNVTLNSQSVLDLSYNYISTDIGNFGYDIYKLNALFKKDVLELYLQHNRIGKLHSYFFNPFIRLITMDLSWNEINYIEYKCFSAFDHLKNLSLAGNPIGELNIKLSSALEVLNISSCNLSSLGEEMFVGLHLTTLDISNNNLASLNWSLIDSSTQVLMDGNPWDCNLLWWNKPEFARRLERCTTTIWPETTTAAAITEAVTTASTTAKGGQTVWTTGPEDEQWNAFVTVEGVLVGLLVFFLLLWSAACIRARSLQRDGNWLLESRL